MDYRYELDISWLKQSSPEQTKHNDYTDDTPPALPEKPPRQYLEAIRKESISNDLLLHELESASFKNPLIGPRELPYEHYNTEPRPFRAPSNRKLPNPLPISPTNLNPIQPAQSFSSPKHVYSSPKLPTLPQLPLKMARNEPSPQVADVYTKPLPKTPMEKDLGIGVPPPEPLPIGSQKSPSPLRVETSDSFGVFGRKSSPIKSTPTENVSRKSWPSPTRIYQKLSPDRSFKSRDTYQSDDDLEIQNGQFAYSEDIEIFPQDTNLDDTLDEITYLLEENRLNHSQTLPELPFTPNSLLPSDFDALECSNLLSSIWDWCIRLFEKNSKKIPNYDDLLKCLYLLLNYWFPTLSHYYLEEQSASIIQELIQQGAISLSEDYQIIPNYDAYVNGVLLGLVCCYGQHYDNGDYSQCYRPSCAFGKNTFNIQLSKPPLGRIDSSLPVQERIIQYTSGSWDDFWGVSIEEVKELPPKTYELQATIFELILSELRTARNAKILIDVYSSKFLKEHSSIIKKGERIYEGLFQPLQVWNDVHRQYLVDPLLDVIKSQGKFISKFASIYIQWASRAEAVSIDYVSKSFLSLKILEAEKKRPGSKVIKWFEDISRNIQSSLIDDYSMIIRAPIFRPIKLQPTIERILKLTDENDPEKAELAKALNMSRSLMKNVENAVNVLESQHSIGILKRELDCKHSIDYLNLDRKGRYVAESGDVKRKSIIDKSSYHLILLDNYLLITERIHDDPVKKFKIVESPIPVEYLLFMSKDKEPSSSLQGQPNAGLDDADQFSFKIKQLGSDTSHTFYTQTREERNKWLFSISTVKQRLSEKVRRYEPFSLSVISDREFTYSERDTVAKTNPLPKDGALDVALRSVEDIDDVPTKMQSNVLSSCSFRYNNQDYVFLGLSLAGYVSPKGQPNSAKRLLELSHIKQCAVLEEYELLIVLSDKKLLYFNLNDVMKVYFGTSHSVEGHRFSRQSVSFFAVAKNYEHTTMIFFMKPKARISNFKILIPIKDSVSKKFDYFLEHKKFCVDCDTYKMTLFKNSFVVHTSKGFELMSLSVLKPHSIPVLHYSDLFIDSHTSGKHSSVKKRLNSNNLKPVGIFRLNNSEKFLLVYSQFAVFVNRESEIVGECIEFQFKCKSAALDHDYLIVTNDQVIEVWMIGDNDAKIVQFFTGENVVLIDDTPGQAMVSMTHPKHPERQLVLSFCLKNQFKRVAHY